MSPLSAPATVLSAAASPPGVPPRRRVLWPELLIVGLALVARFGMYPDRSFWYDEIFTLETARLPLLSTEPFARPGQSILSVCLLDAGIGPLAYALDGMFASKAWLGGGEYWLRLPGIGASLALLVSVLVWGGRLFGGRVGTLAAGLWIAFAPPMVHAAVGARGYSWALLLGFAQLALLSALAAPPRSASGSLPPASTFRGGRLWALLALIGAVAVLVHPIHAAATLSVACAAVVLRVVGGRRSALAALRPLSFAGGVLFAFAVVAAWMIPWARGLKYAKSALASAPRHLSWSTVSEKLVKGLSDNPEIALILGGCGVAFLIGRPFWRSRLLFPQALTALTFLGAGLGVYVIMSALFWVHPRHLYLLQIPLVWLLGRGVGLGAMVLRRRIGVGRRPALRAAALAGLVALSAAGVVAGWREAARPTQDWRRAVAWLAGQWRPGDVIYCQRVTELRPLRLYAATWKDHPPEFTQAKTVADPAQLFPTAGTGGRVWFLTAWWPSTPELARVLESLPRVAVWPGERTVEVYCSTGTGSGWSAER